MEKFRRLDVVNTVVSALTLALSCYAVYASTREEPEKISVSRPYLDEQADITFVDIGAETEAIQRNPSPYAAGIPIGFCCWSSYVNRIPLIFTVSNLSGQTLSLTGASMIEEYKRNSPPKDEILGSRYLSSDVDFPINIPAHSSARLTLFVRYGLDLDEHVEDECGKQKNLFGIKICVSHFARTAKHKGWTYGEAISTRPREILLYTSSGSAHRVLVDDASKADE